MDCFPTDSCLSSLLSDVMNRGFCEQIVASLYGVPISQNCDANIGSCSQQTVDMLLAADNQCLIDMFQQQGIVSSTLQLLLIECGTEVLEKWLEFLIKNKYVTSTTLQRFAPESIIAQDFRTKLEYENTRHRYPWVCSVRSTGSSPAHRCAVNLLAVPPDPTKFVGAAHCTFVCKDGGEGGTEVPVCCCSRDTRYCGLTNPECGMNPEVVDMAPSDSVILCGEFDTRENDFRDSGERYNVEFTILEIVKHPEFSVTNGNDISIFKVDDEVLKNDANLQNELRPACLPSTSKGIPKTGLQSGWSQPPPLPFILSQAKLYAEIYDNFFKQWHYKLDILETCEDPKINRVCNNLQFPTNTYYPQGTICAKDFTRDTCFSTGDSGSPLMIQYEDDNQDRMHIAGILSSIKGCSSVGSPFIRSSLIFADEAFFDPSSSSFITVDPDTEVPNNFVQYAENPTIYTKLSCYLPWIAEQYNMRYQGAGTEDTACQQGTGNKDVGNNPCRGISYGWDPDDQGFNLITTEKECKFPFFYRGVKYHECILFTELEFTYPAFRCPTRY